MSDFFGWLSQYVPLGFMLILWLITAPVRVALILVLPFGARRYSHPLNFVYEFFAFEERL